MINLFFGLFFGFITGYTACCIFVVSKESDEEKAEEIKYLRFATEEDKTKRELFELALDRRYLINDLVKENAELKKEISVLLSCSDCPENKGGYICEKEYNNKCLAQKIEHIKELNEEVADLKAQIESLAKTNIKAQTIIAELKEQNKDLCESLDIMNNRESDLLDQIEKMKCCGNCKHYEIHTTKEGIKYCLTCRQLDENKEKIIYPKWEMYE